MVLLIPGVQTFAQPDIIPEDDTIGPVGTIDVAVQQPSDEILALLELSETETDIQEQERIKDELNALGVPTTEQLDSNFEYWTLKSSYTKLAEDPFVEKTNQEITLATYQSVQCPGCNPEPDKVAYFPGYWYDCGLAYQCSASVSSWVLVEELQSRSITFHNTSPESNPSVRGWYYVQGPQDSTLVDWDDIYIVNPTGFDERHYYVEDVNPSKLKLMPVINNVQQSHQVGFVFTVHSID